MPSVSHYRNQLLALIALSCLFYAPSAQAQVQETVYNQPTNLGGSDTSQYDPITYGNYATAYDNFMLGTDALISSVSWAGNYFSLVGSPGGVTGFTIQFYADNGGVPGDVLASEAIVGDADEDFFGTDATDDPVYTYWAPLPTTFDAVLGTQYWMSIVANLGYPPQWGWESGTGGDGAAYQNDFGYTFPLSNDLTFSLAYTVPEPGSIALFTGLGLAAGLCLRRRKRGSKMK